MLLSPSTVSISHALPNPLLSFLLFYNTDSFVNSQEWTLSRSVPDLRLVSAFTGLLVTVLTSFLCPLTLRASLARSARASQPSFIDTSLAPICRTNRPKVDALRRKSSLTTRATCSLSETRAVLPKCRLVAVSLVAITKVSLASGHVQLTSATGRTCTYGQANLYPVSLTCTNVILFSFPYLQLSGWVDAVLFVFSVEDESSFNAVATFYHRMIHLRSNNDNIPVFLVGTQGGSSH